MMFWKVVYMRPCPECGETVVYPDNSTLLDWPAEPYSEEACWTVEKVVNFPGFRKKTRYLAMRGRGPSIDPKTGMRVGHRLHVHQPPESIVRRGRNPWEVEIHAS